MRAVVPWVIVAPQPSLVRRCVQTDRCDLNFRSKRHRRETRSCEPLRARARIAERQQHRLFHFPALDVRAFDAHPQAGVRRRDEGQKLGLVGQIHGYERLLRHAQTPAAQLLALPLEELEVLAQQLEAEVTRSLSSLS